MAEILPVPNALLGIDVSHYQGQIDWTDVAESGVKFAWIKATDGASVADPMLKTNIDGATAAGLPFGLYHFWRPQDPASDQTANLLSVLDNLWPLAGAGPNPAIPAGCIGIALDLEEGTLTEDNQQDALVTLHAWDFGKSPMVYCSPSFAQVNLTDPAWLDYPLWIAHYTDAPQPNVGRWPRWTFWQRQNNGIVPGISGPVDIDWFNGSAEDLAKLTVPPST